MITVVNYRDTIYDTYYCVSIIISSYITVLDGLFPLHGLISCLSMIVITVTVVIVISIINIVVTIVATSVNSIGSHDSNTTNSVGTIIYYNTISTIISYINTNVKLL